jgi:hypothetical protein
MRLLEIPDISGRPKQTNAGRQRPPRAGRLVKQTNNRTFLPVLTCNGRRRRECRCQREHWSEHLLRHCTHPRDSRYDHGGRGTERTIEELLEFSEAVGAKKVLEWCSQHKNDPTPTQDDDADSPPCSEKSRDFRPTLQ